MHSRKICPQRNKGDIFHWSCGVQGLAMRSLLETAWEYWNTIQTDGLQNQKPLQFVWFPFYGRIKKKIIVGGCMANNKTWQYNSKNKKNINTQKRCREGEDEWGIWFLKTKILNTFFSSPSPPKQHTAKCRKCTDRQLKSSWEAWKKLGTTLEDWPWFYWKRKLLRSLWSVHKPCREREVKIVFILWVLPIALQRKSHFPGIWLEFTYHTWNNTSNPLLGYRLNITTSEHLHSEKNLEIFVTPASADSHFLLNIKFWRTLPASDSSYSL